MEESERAVRPPNFFFWWETPIGREVLNRIMTTPDDLAHIGAYLEGVMWATGGHQWKPLLQRVLPSGDKRGKSRSHQIADYAAMGMEKPLYSSFIELVRDLYPIPLAERASRFAFSRIAFALKAICQVRPDLLLFITPRMNQLSQADVHSLLMNMWSAEFLGDDAIVLDMRIAGEMDGAISVETLDAIQRRSGRPMETLLTEAFSGEAPLLFENLSNGDQDVESIIQRLLSSNRLPVLVDGRRSRWVKNLDLTIRDYLHQQTAGLWLSGTPICEVILIRPELIKDGVSSIDPSKLRHEIFSWQRKDANRKAIVLTQRGSFLSHHPVSEMRIFSVRAATQATNWFPVRNRAIAKQTRSLIAALRSNTSAEMLAYNAYNFFLQENDEFEIQLGHFCAMLQQPDSVLFPLFREVLDHKWLEKPTFIELMRKSGAPFGFAEMQATVGSRMYRALHDLHPTGFRSTFKGLDLGNWLCFLRSVGYDFVSNVLKFTEREDLSGLNLVHAPAMEYANLRYANLARSDLYRLNLAAADLSKADLRNCDLARAHLKEARLIEADLRGADLSFAILDLADLTGAKLDGANLEFASLVGTRGP